MMTFFTGRDGTSNRFLTVAARLKPAVFILLFLGAAYAETTVLLNFTLIDGTGTEPIPKASMVIVDGRIHWVGPADKLRLPSGGHNINLAGKYVMPGIINLHGHVGNTIDLAQDPANFTRGNVESQLRSYANYGVTSVCSMGSEQPLIMEMRAEQRLTNRPQMARIFTALRGFTGVGGYPTTAPGMKGVPYEVSTVEEV